MANYKTISPYNTVRLNNNIRGGNVLVRRRVTDLTRNYLLLVYKLILIRQLFMDYLVFEQVSKIKLHVKTNL